MAEECVWRWTAGFGRRDEDVGCVDGGRGRLSGSGSWSSEQASKVGLFECGSGREHKQEEQSTSIYVPPVRVEQAVAGGGVPVG